MSVSTVDGIIESVEHGRRAAKVQFFKKLIFRLDDGGTKTVVKAVVHRELAEHLQVGARGRFYLYTAFDHRGVHGFRGADGQEMFRFPRNNEVLMLIIVPIMLAWVIGALIIAGGVPLLPTLLVLAGTPFFLLYRKSRLEAQRQYENDRAFVPAAREAPAAAAAAGPAVPA